MAKLTDPDSLSVAVNTTATTEEVEIQTGAKTIEFRIAGNLDDTAPGKTSGLTGKCAYSFLKEEWLANPTLRRFRFPIKMIFEGSFIWVNGWAPANQQTRDLLRDAGFEEQVSGKKNACNISLGSMNDSASDLGYYIQTQSHTAPPTDYDKTGELNENIDITAATTYLKAFLREQGKTYSEYELLTEQGLASLTFQAYSFPLVNSIDQKINESDANIDTNAPYTGMEINYLKGSGFTTWANSTVYPAGAVVQSLTGRWFFTALGGTSNGTDVGNDTGVTDWVAYAGEFQIGSLYYAGNRVINANGGTDIQAYNFMQRQLRLTTSINSDTVTPVAQGGFGLVNGEVAQLLGSYEGDTLILAPGVVLTNFNTNSTNNINHQTINVDTGGLDSNDVPLSVTRRAFPFKAAGNFVFSDNFVAEPDIDTVYTVYFDWITEDISTGIALTGASGATATLDWTADAGILNHLTNGDYINVAGFTGTTTNNGLYLVTGTPSANTVTVTKQDGVTVVNETAGNSVTVHLNPFESPGAIIVDNDAGTDLDAQITAKTIAWDFDYTNNNQGGRTPNTPAPCTIVAISKDGAEWAEASFTISAATGLNIPVNGNDERNYENA